MVTFLSKSKNNGNKLHTKNRNIISVKSIIATLVLTLCTVFNLYAQVDVTASSGATTGTYATLKIAIDSVNSGYHQGAIAITFTGASETAPPTGIIINGSGMTNALLQASNYTSLSITGPYTINAGAGTATPASLIADGILGLNGADNVTISGLTLLDNNVANPATMEYGIGLFRPSGSNGCQNNIITGNTITLKLVNNVAGAGVAGSWQSVDGSVGILGTYASKDSTGKTHATYTALGTNSNNTIKSNTISFCQHGIGFIGNLTTSIANADKNNVFGGTIAADGNTVTNFGSSASTREAAGIRVTNGWDYIVRFNTVNNNNGAAGASNNGAFNRGISCYTPHGANVTIDNNTVTMKNGLVGSAFNCIENTPANIYAASFSNTVSMSNNTILNCQVFQGTTTAVNLIVNSGFPAFNMNMNGNTFTGNKSAATSGAHNHLVNNSGGSGYSQGSINMNNNIVTDFTFNGTAANTGINYYIWNINTAPVAAISPTIKTNVSLSNNSITGVTYPAGFAGTGTTYYVTNGGSGTAGQYYNKVTMNSNVVQNMNMNATGGIHYGIYNLYGGCATSVNIDSNSVRNIAFTNATLSPSFYAIFASAGGHANNIPIKLNANKVINNSVIAGTGTMYSMYSSQAAAVTTNHPNLEMAFDTVMNNKWLTTGAYYGMFGNNFGDNATGTISPSMHDNYIGKNRNNGFAYLLYPSSGASNAIMPLAIYNNKIVDDTTGGVSSTIYGVYQFPAAALGGTAVYNNLITGLVTTGATSPTIVGIYQSGSGVNRIYNNMISNFIPTAVPNTVFNPVIGMQIFSATTTNIYNNTVKLDSTGFPFSRSVGLTGLAYGSSTLSAFNVSNNIFYVNAFGNSPTATTGNLVAAVRRNLFVGVGGSVAGVPPTATQFNANNNIYWAPTNAAIANTYLYTECSALSGTAPSVNGYHISGLTASAPNNIVNDPNFNTPCGLYKKFMGLGRELNTFTENNLVAGASVGLFLPSGASYAESGAAPTTNPVVTNDYSYVTRGNPADIGALEFAGTILDAAPPTIGYTSVANTICQSAPTISATITDASGVNVTPSTKPRIYYKKFTNANALVGNLAADNGWKYVEATNSASPFTFTMDYNILFGGAPTVGDSIQYFIDAQDNAATPNVGINLATGAVGSTCPTSVDLAAAFFPATGVKIFKLIALPNTVTTLASPQYICGSGNTTLSLGGDPSFGVTHQWEAAPASGGTWIPLLGQTNATLSFNPITNSAQFRDILSCNGVPITIGGNPAGTSTPVTVFVSNPVLNSAPGVSRCGSGPVSLTASVNAGSTALWYKVLTGDTAVATGTTFTTNVASTPPTTTYYVAAAGACNPYNMGLTPPTNYFSTTAVGYGQFFDVQNSAGITIDSLDLYGVGSAGTTGTATIQLINPAGAVIGTYGPFTVNNYTLGANGTPFSLTPTRIGFGATCSGIPVPQGNGYRLVVSAMATTALSYYFSSNPVIPYPMMANGIGIAQITGGSLNSAVIQPNYNNYLYNWKISARCATARTAVVVTVTPPPAVTISASVPGTVCQGISNVLTANSSNGGYAYTWAPTTPSFTGNPYTITTGASTTYTVTAADNSGGPFSGCGNVATVVVNTFPPAPFIGASANNTAVCPGGSSTLSVIDSTSFVPSVLPSVGTYTTSAATSTADEDILGFSIGNATTGIINQTSTCTTTGGAAGNGLPASAQSFYSNYTTTGLPIPTFGPGSTVPFTLTLGYCGATAFTNVASVYVDFNRNNVFDLPQELVYTKPSGTNAVAGTTYNSASTPPCVFTIPSVAGTAPGQYQLGATLLRIVYVEAATAPPGGTYTWGETEDYRIKIGYPNSPAVSYQWSGTPVPTFAPIAGNTSTVTAGPINATTVFTIAATDANNCTATQTVSVGVGPLSCGTVTSNKPVLCAGSCATITANPTLGATPYSYKWYQPGNPSPIGLGKSISPCPAITTTYTVVVYSDPTSCSDSCTTTFTQVVTPLPIVNAVNAVGGPIQICGTSTSSVAIAASGASTYTISPTSGAVPASGTGAFTVTIPTTTSYIVTGTDANGCTATTNFTVNYFPDYFIYNVASPNNVCPGGSSTVCVTDTNKGVCNPSTAYVTPVHTTASNCLDTIKIGSYTDASVGCTLPSYTANIASSVVTINVGSTITLSSTLGTPGYSGVWIDLNGDGTFAATEFTALVTNALTASVIITIPTITNAGCTRVRFRSRASSFAGTDANTTFADGETQDYLVSLVRANYTNIVSYAWAQAFPPATNNIVGSTTGSCITTANNTASLNGYVVTITDANGCTKQSASSVFVAPLTCQPITVNGTLNPCRLAPRTLTAVRTGGGAPFTYSWTSSATGATVLSTSATYITPDTVSGAITYTVTIGDACSPAGVCSTTITLNVISSPVLTTALANQPLCAVGTSTIVLSATGNTGTMNYLTTPPVPAGLVNIGPVTFTWTPGASTIYTITGTDGTTGCKGTTTVSMIFSPPFGITAVANPLGIGPCGGTVTLTTVDTVAGPQVILPVNLYGTSAATSLADDEIVGFTLNSGATSLLANFSSCTSIGAGSTTALNTLPASALNTYGNYTNLAPPTLIAGSTYTGTIDVSSCGTFAYSSGQAIFLDWNRNGVWDAPAENVYQSTVTNLGPLTGTTPNSVPFSFTVPGNATAGVTLLRVRINESNPGTSITATSAITWGESEDYLVNILGTSLYPLATKSWSATIGGTITPQGSYSAPTTSLVVSPPGTQSQTCYTVTATNTVGCTATSSVCVTVGPVNCGIATAKFPSVCSGKTDSLFSNPTLGGTPYSFSWVDSATNIVVGSTKNIAVTPTNTGTIDSIITYLVTVTDNCGLSCVTKVTITVKPLPAITITNSLGTAAICVTGSATLTAVPATYPTNLWAPAPTSGAGTATAVITNPNSTTTYTLTVTGANACTNTATNTVVYSPPFTTHPSANPPFIGCASTVTLTTFDTVLALGPQNLPSPNSYGTAASTSTADDEITGVSITGTPLNTVSSCTSLGGASTTPLNGLPASALTLYSNFTNLPATTIISGSTYSGVINISNCGTFAFSSGQAIFIDWNRDGVWNPGETAFASAGTTPGGVSPASVAVPFTFTVPATAAAGVTLMRVRINESQVGTAITPISASTWGETEDYAVNIIGKTRDTSATYNWAASPTNAGPFAGRTIVNTLAGTSVYTVTSTNALGCTTTASVTIAVTPLACAPITTPKDSICSGGTTILTGGTTGGGVPSYVWTGSANTTILNSNTAIATVSATNTVVPGVRVSEIFTLTITDACGATCSETFTVKVDPAPSVAISASTTSICAGTAGTSSVLIAAASSSNSTIASPSGYVWTDPNPTSPTLSVLTGGTTVASPATSVNNIYTITVKDANNCTATSTVNVHYSPAYAIQSIAVPPSIGICGGTVVLKAIDTVAGSQILPVINTYGNPASTSLADDEITGVSIAGTPLNTISSCTSLGGASTTPLNTLPASSLTLYSNFTNLPPTTLLSGTTYSGVINVTNCGTFAYNSGQAIFIDWNRNGNWDAGETAYASPGTTQGGLTPASVAMPFTFTVPTTATPGVTLMRVRINESQNGTAITPISPSTWGETEDYLVNLLVAPAVPIASYAWTDSFATATLTSGSNTQNVNAVMTTGGTYTVTATNIYGCTASSTVTVTQVPLALTSVTLKANTAPTAICTGKCDTVKVKFTGGGAPHVVTFNPSTSITSITDSTWKACPTVTTVYTVIVTDVCNTSVSSTFSVFVNPSPIITCPVSVSSCGGPGNVIIGAAACLSCNTTVWTTPTGGTNTNAQFTVNATASGIYTVTGTDLFGCTSTATQVVNVSNPHTINVTSSPALVCNGDSVTLAFTDSTIIVGNQVAPTNYCVPGTTNSQGSDHITNVTIANLNANTGATANASGYAGLTTSPVVNVTCGSNYVLSISIANGGTEFGAAWIDWNNDGVFGVSESYIPATFTLSAGVWTGSIPVSVPATAIAGVKRMRVRSKFAATVLTTDACTAWTWGETEDYLVNLSCAGPSNNLSWYYASTPSILTDSNLNPVKSGKLNSVTNYTLTVTDFAGCTYTKTKTVFVNTPITLSTVVKNLKCFNKKEGEITLNANGGTPGANPTYTFTWIDSSNSLPSLFFPKATSLGAGTYTLQATDAIGCTNTITALVTRPDTFYATIAASSASCFGGASDTTKLNIVGGVLPYNLQLNLNFGSLLDITASNTTDPTGVFYGQSTKFFNLVAGCYKAFVSDVNGCELDPIFDPYVYFCITQPSAPLQLSVSITDTNLCFKDSIAKITCSATGGTPGYKYSIDTVNYFSNPVFNNLGAGTYTVRVKDTSNICIDDTVIVIGHPAKLVQIIDSMVAPLCNGGCGSIGYHSTGGTGALTYKINTNVYPLACTPAGIYTLQSTDINNCKIDTTVTLGQPNNLVLSPTFTDALCFGANGTITVSFTGGTNPVSAKIDNLLVNPAGYPAGKHYISITDSNGCTKSDSVTIGQPTEIIQSASTTDAKCFGGTGTIVNVSTGGTGTLVDSISTAPLGLNYVFGNYLVVTTDSNGCKVDTLVSIAQPPQIILTATATESNCNGDSVVITASATGGNGTPIVITINGQPIKPKYAPGPYNVVATNDSGCSVNQIIVINTPVAVIQTVTATNPTCYGVNGAITLSSTGGTGVLTDSINGVVAPLAAYPAGTYTLVTKDSLGCTADTIITLIQPDSLTINVVIDAAKCAGDTNIVTVTATGGTGNKLINLGNPYGTYTAPLHMVAGNYTITVTDDNGCVKTKQITIVPTPAQLATVFSVTNALCSSDSGQITFSVSGGTINYSTTATTLTGALTSPITGLVGGTYYFTTQDAKQCKVYDTIIVANIPDTIKINAVVVNPACGTVTTGSITATTTGGTGVHIVVIDNDTTNTGTYAIGPHVINVYDSNGCSASQIVNIISATNFNLNTVATITQICDSTTVILNTTNGAGLPLTYTIVGSDGSTPQVGVPFKMVGTITFIVTGNDGSCTDNDTIVVVGQSRPITHTFTASQPKCFDSLGSITFTVTGGTGLISTTEATLGAVTSAIAPLAANTYYFTSTDSFGCVVLDTVTINNAPDSIRINATATSPNCIAVPTGTIATNVIGGTPTYTVTIGSTIATNGTFIPGTYVVNVVDSKGCTNSQSVTITPGASLNVSGSATTTTICANTTVVLTGSSTASGVTFTWSGATPAPIDGAPYSVADTTTFILTGSNGTCSELDTVIVNASDNGGLLAQTIVFAGNSIAGNVCSGPTMTPDGAMIDYSDPICNLIATVQDANGGNVLGAVAACVEVSPTVQVWNMQPYVARTYTITPTNQGPASVTLYYTNDDMQDYNSYITSSGSTFPPFATTANPANGATMSVCITKLDGGGLGIGTVTSVIPATATWDSAGAYWKVTFPVTSFSSFFCHTCNPQNVPLSVSLLSFTGHKEANSDVLNWVTSSETDNKLFNLQHSADGVQFKPLATINSKAVNGNSNSPLSYQGTNNNPVIGHNYYRLQQVDMANRITYSKVVDILWSFDGSQVTVYPNPTQNELHIDVNVNKNTMATIKVMDVTGKVVKQVETELTKGMNTNTIDLGDIASGVYMLKLTDGKGLNYSQQFKKQ